MIERTHFKQSALKANATELQQHSPGRCVQSLAIVGELFANLPTCSSHRSNGVLLGSISGTESRETGIFSPPSQHSESVKHQAHKIGCKAVVISGK